MFNLTLSAQTPQQTPEPPPTAEASTDDSGSAAEDWQLKRGAIEVGIDVGFAPLQPTFLSGVKEYDTSGRKLVMVSGRVGRVIGTVKGMTIEYLFEVAPLTLALKNEVENPAYVSETETPNVSPTVRKTTYGFGIEPAEFRFIFRPKKRLKPFVQVGAGFLFSSEPIPVPQSPRYNFIGDFGAGLMYHVKPKQTLNFGYRYYHISNMNIGTINPGYNANIFYVGYSFFSK